MSVLRNRLHFRSRGQLYVALVQMYVALQYAVLWRVIQHTYHISIRTSTKKADCGAKRIEIWALGKIVQPI